MTAKYQQIALNDIFSDFQSKLIDNYPLSLFFFQNTLISMNLFTRVLFGFQVSLKSPILPYYHVLNIISMLTLNLCFKEWGIIPSPSAS